MQNLAPGNYFVRATSNATGCESLLLEFVIIDNAVPPILSETIIPLTRCDSPDGSLSIDIDGGANILNYSISWYSGIDNTGVLVGSNTSQITDLDAGDYFIEVVNLSTQCQSELLMVVPDSRDIPSTAVISGGAVLCPGDEARIKIDISGGTGPFTVVYNDGAGNIGRDSYDRGTEFTVVPKPNQDPRLLPSFPLRIQRDVRQ